MLNTSTHKLRINNFIEESIVDGFGLRFVIFTQGCNLRCKGCHNPFTHDLDGGHLIDITEIQNKWRKNPLLRGITISGGEPFLQVEVVSELVKLAKNDHLDVTLYSGYTYETLRSRECPYTDLILNTADYLIDGPYIEALRNLNLLFRGSSNQRIIDLNETRKEKKLVILDK